jgi:thioredoxin 1
MGFIELNSESELQDIITNENMLTLIDCYADWCGPCKTLYTQMNEYIETNNITCINFCKLNVDNEEFAEFVKINNITSLPTIIFVQDDNIIKRIVGNKFSEIQVIIDDFVDKFNELLKIESKKGKK